jgi:hypothetical protein
VTSLGAKVGLLDRPHDPYDDVVMPLTGDYTAMHRLGDALQHPAVNVARAAQLRQGVAVAARPP